MDKSSGLNSCIHETNTAGSTMDRNSEEIRTAASRCAAKNKARRVNKAIRRKLLNDAAETKKNDHSKCFLADECDIIADISKAETLQNSDPSSDLNETSSSVIERSLPFVSPANNSPIFLNT